MDNRGKMADISLKVVTEGHVQFLYYFSSTQQVSWITFMPKIYWINKWTSCYYCNGQAPSSLAFFTIEISTQSSSSQTTMFQMRINPPINKWTINGLWHIEFFLISFSFLLNSIFLEETRVMVLQRPGQSWTYLPLRSAHTPSAGHRSETSMWAEGKRRPVLWDH